MNMATALRPGLLRIKEYRRESVSRGQGVWMGFLLVFLFPLNPGVHLISLVALPWAPLIIITPSLLRLES